jgi:hypothetical protein
VFSNAAHAGQHRVRVEHPVQRRVGEHRVELGLERQPLAVGQADVQAQRRGRRDQLGRGVDPDHPRARGRQRPRQRAVAAAQVQDVLARPRREQVDHRRAQLGNEARVGRVPFGVPALAGRRGFGWVHAGSTPCVGQR